MPDLGRRHALGLIGVGLAAAPLWAQDMADLHLPGGNGKRPTTNAFPGKRNMILQRSRAPLLETPLDAFDGQVFTHNDRFFVRWHYADIPLSVDVRKFRLAVIGATKQDLSLSLGDLLAMPRVELAAVNQCSGNSRGLFMPHVPGAQWGNGAIGNAKWVGVRLKDVLDRAGVMSGAVQVRASGLDQPTGDAPLFAKSLDIAHAMDGEVMIAFHMNGAQLPMLNGFPLRLIVPGWYSTYWVKALDRLEVLDKPDTGFWMDKAYRIPPAPRANVVPGAKDFPTEPITRMVPRAFFTNVAAGAVHAGGALHQQRRRDAGLRSELEPRRFHAQRHRTCRGEDRLMRRAAFFPLLLLLLGVFGWYWLAHRPPRVTATATSVAAAGVTLTSQQLTLPEEKAAFPAGAQGTLLTNNCTGCHSPEMILTQPVFGADKWQATVDKMRKAYHAPVAPADDAKIVAALLALPPQRAAPAK